MNEYSLNTSLGRNQGPILVKENCFYCVLSPAQAVLIPQPGHMFDKIQDGQMMDHHQRDTTLEKKLSNGVNKHSQLLIKTQDIDLFRSIYAMSLN